MQVAEKVICSICNKDSYFTKYPYINALYDETLGNLFRELEICVCQNCGFGFAMPMVSQERLDDFYKNQYRANTGSHAHQLKKPSLLSKYGVRGLSQLQLARTFLNQTDGPKRILDVGSGPGDALLAAKALFPQSSLFAIEPDQFSHLFLKQMGVYVYGISFNPKNFSQLDQTFDLILCSHVMEHFNIQDIPEIIKGLKSLLSEQGVIIFEVPHVDMRYYSKRDNDAPHLSFFSKDSFGKLLEKEFKVLFCNGCGPVISNSKLRKNIKRPFLDRLRSKFNGESIAEYLSSSLFAYGLQRSFIRAVVTKKTHD